MNYNIIDKTITYHWKQTFNGVLEHLKQNFSIFNNNFRSRRAKSIIYLMTQNYKKNICSVCNSIKYNTHEEFLDDHFTQRFFCYRTLKTGKYHWLDYVSLGGRLEDNLHIFYIKQFATGVGYTFIDLFKL